MEQSNSLFELQIDQRTSVFLKETAKWSKFLAIVGFILMALVIIVLLFAGAAMNSMMSSAYGTTSTGAGGSFQLILFAAFMLIYFFPTYYLYKFATKMQVALRTNDQEMLNTSFENLKSCFKFMGIFMIIILAIYGIAFLGILAMGGLGANL